MSAEKNPVPLVDPPTGHTPNGTPYWEMRHGPRKGQRVLGPWPAYPKAAS